MQYEEWPYHIQSRPPYVVAYNWPFKHQMSSLHDCVHNVLQLATSHSIDWHRFNATKLSIAAAGKLTVINPCTNVSLKCPLCRDGADAILKYSLWLFIHTLKYILQQTFSDTRIYMYKLDSHEHTSMEELYNSKTSTIQKEDEDHCRDQSLWST